MLSGGKFFFACAMLAAIVLFVGRFVPLPLSLLAAEVFATILGLFFFGLLSARHNRWSLMPSSPRRRRRLYASAVDQRDDPYHRPAAVIDHRTHLPGRGSVLRQ